MTSPRLRPEYIKLTPQTRLYNLSVPIVGLTGGVATGKSTVAKLFAENNFAVINADDLVKKTYQRSEVVEQLKKIFPSAVKQSQAQFSVLRQLAFKNKENLKKLEDLIYPYLPYEFNRELLRHDQARVVIYEVPLLFEKKLESLFDLVICVCATQEEQVERLQIRDNIAYQLALQMVQSQLPIEIKQVLADESINNSLEQAHMQNQFQQLMDKLFTR